MSSDWSPDSYISAYRFAAEVHWNKRHKQVVPGTEIPYLMHFSLVAMEVIAALEREPGLDGDFAVQCALLHDTLEDTNTTFEQLVDRFGPTVADGVLALTKEESVGGGKSKPERERLRTVDSLERILKQPREIWMVKLADRITNLLPPPSHWSADRIRRYREEATQILQTLKDASRYLAARLEDKILRYCPNLTKGHGK